MQNELMTSGNEQLDDEAWMMPVLELKRRRDAVLSAMDMANIDVAAFTDPETVCYVSGVDIGGRARGKALLLAADGSHRYVTRRLERLWQPYWAERSWCVDWAWHDDTETLREALTRLAHDLVGGQPRRLGLDLSRSGLSPFDAAALGDSAKTCVDIAPAVELIRRVKSEPELCAMRRAGEITAAGAFAAEAAVRAGAAEHEATAAAFAALTAPSGAQAPVSGPFVNYGPRTARAHSNWGHAQSKPGEVVILGMTGTCQRYTAPLERTYVRGDPPDATARMLEACSAAGEATLRGLRPGVTAHEGDRMCREVFEDAGFAEHFMNRAAYGIGLSYPPSWMESLVQLRPNDETELEAGMTLHVVPALHVEGFGFLIRSIALEITDDGCVPLYPQPETINPL